MLDEDKKFIKFLNDMLNTLTPSTAEKQMSTLEKKAEKISEVKLGMATAHLDIENQTIKIKIPGLTKIIDIACEDSWCVDNMWWHKHNELSDIGCFDIELYR